MRTMREIVVPCRVFVHGPADWMVCKPFTEKAITIDAAGVYSTLKGQIGV